MERLEIRHRRTNEIIFSDTARGNSIKKTLEQALKLDIDLSHANFEGFNFEGITFNKTFLKCASFKNATFKNVLFFNCNLSHANFMCSNIGSSKITLCNLNYTILNKVEINNSILDFNTMIRTGVDRNILNHINGSDKSLLRIRN